MARSSVVKFADPQSYQAAVYPAQVEILVTAKGDFKAELRSVEFSELWVQRGNCSLPRITNFASSADRPAIFFLTGPDKATISHSGRDFGPGEIVTLASGATHHHRTVEKCQWGTLSLTREDLNAATRALVGRDAIDRSVTHYLRPRVAEMSRLSNLHKIAGEFAENGKDLLAQPELARALEQAMLYATVMCLSEAVPVQMGLASVKHNAIIAKFEEFLAANYDRPLHLLEICAAVGASERTLRVSCIEHFGMGPVRYLWLRRMNMVRRALVQAVPGTTTVTDIATANGFWELGRFAVEYRALFGEVPSATLHRPAEEVRKSRSSPFAFSASEYA
jgi:AraC-like DNA-binding protein